MSFHFSKISRTKLGQVLLISHVQKKFNLYDVVVV